MTAAGVEKKAEMPTGPAVRELCAAALAAALCLSALAGEEPAPGAEDPRPGPLIKKIEVVGSASKSEAALKLELATREGGHYDPDVLDSDIKRLWATDRYRDIRWEGPFEVEGGVRLRLVLEERPRLAKVEFRGNKKISSSDLEDAVKKVGLRPGGRARYDRALAFSAAKAVEDLYREKNFFRARVKFYAEQYEGPGDRTPPSVKLVFDVFEGPPTPIKGIRFEGNRVFTDEELLRVMQGVRPRRAGSGGEFDRLKLERDLRGMELLYRDAGYLDAEVSLKKLELFTLAPDGVPERTWLVPHIEVREGPRYTVGAITLKVEGKHAEELAKEGLAERDLLALVTDPPEEMMHRRPLRGKSPYSARAEEEAAWRLWRTLRERGRLGSDVEHKMRLREEGTEIDVAFTVTPSRVYRLGKVGVRGNYKTKPRVFLRELEQAGVEAGEPIDVRKLDLAVINIRNTGVVKDDIDLGTGRLRRPAVRIVPFPREDGTADLSVDVNEGETGYFTLGVGVSSNEEVSGQIEYKDTNFNIFGLPRSLTDWTNAFRGAGQTLSLSAYLGTATTRYDLSFIEPYFLGWPVRFRLGLFNWESRRETYTEGREGGAISLGKSWQLHKYKRRRLGLSFPFTDETVRISDVSATAPADIKDDEGTHRVKRGGIELSFDSRDDIFLPRQGWLLRLSGHAAGGPMGGEEDFTKLGLDLQKHLSLGTGRGNQPHVLQFRLRLDAASPYGDTERVPVFERYFAGGIMSLRGFRYRSVGPRYPTDTDPLGIPIGGNVRLMETLEYSFPMSVDGSVRGALFLDAGNVWRETADFDFRDQKKSAGLGILLKPAGFPVPIAFYFGWVIGKEPWDREERFSFMIGSMFF